MPGPTDLSASRPRKLRKKGLESRRQGGGATRFAWPAGDTDRTVSPGCNAAGREAQARGARDTKSGAGCDPEGGYTPAGAIVRVVPPGDDAPLVQSMSTPAIIFLAVVGLLLLMMLVAFGLGHKRWSWVSVAASFLVALALAGYLYLASQLLDFEWKWVQLARATQLELQKVRDAVQPSADPANRGRLEPIEGGRSIAALERERDRWQRALERIDNWRGRNWAKATFEPPSLDGNTPGTITLKPPATVADADDEPAAEGEGDAAAPAPAAGKPLDPGDTVYVFDDKPAAGGGLYLGGFLVEAVEPAEPAGTLRLIVRQTAPPDDYDRASWGQGGEYESVTVYDQLPADRWLAFSEVSRSGPVGTLDTRIAPQPEKRSEEEIVQLVPEPFREGVERHALSAAAAGDLESIPEAELPDVRKALEDGVTLPGEVWAEVVFESQVDLDAFLGLERDDMAEAEATLSAEVELGKADELAADGKATIRKVFRRRRLIDAATLVHGSVVPGPEGEVMADGLANLLQWLKNDIAALDAANQRLAESQKNIQAENDLVARQVAELSADLAEWARDVAAATTLADAYQGEAERAAQRLEITERKVVELGEEYDRLIRDLVRRIDAIAPPPTAAAAPAANF
jgi:hypothetical protein